jgi:hypothetical protein
VHLNVSKGRNASIFRTELRNRGNFAPVKNQETECAASMGEMRKAHKILFGMTREKNNVSDLMAIRSKIGIQGTEPRLICGLDSADTEL